MSKEVTTYHAHVVEGRMARVRENEKFLFLKHR
jgi:hypothetical protein